MPAIPAAMQITGFGEPLAKLRQLHLAKALVGTERQFKRGTLQMIHQDFEIVRLDAGMFGRAAEKIIRMLHDELIERRGGSHHYGAGGAAAASGAARPLPRGRD